MENIKIAYLLLVHKDYEQINIFIKQLLQYGDCDIYIHVDKKNPELMDKIIKSSRIFVCSVYEVNWGSFEIVKAAYELMRIVKKSKKKYSHIYFGSGQDMLIKKGMYEYLASKPGIIFMHIAGEIKSNNRVSARYRICWPKKLMIRNDLHIYRFIRIVMQLLCKFGFVINKNRRKLKNKIKFYEGRTWFIAPIEVVYYIINYLEQNKDYIMFWKDSLASDLMFFQTIIMNSPYAKQVEDELMYVEFGNTFATINHPITITVKKLREIEKENYFCARKFEYLDGKAAIRYCLDLTK